MYDLEKLCQGIHMPEEVTEIILSAPEEDTLGFATLREHLLAACKAWDVYQQKGIGEDIYLDTMGAFSRFVREHRVSFGCYGFDRGFWTIRQTGCILFRIGVLEYELREQDVSLHIPSDASLTRQELRDSLERAKEFLARFFPDYVSLPMTCHSWLLSPELPGLLEPEARILTFQRGFAITPAEDDGNFRLWAFRRSDLSYEELPENTTLQRRLKAFLLEGNRFHSGRGVLRSDAWRA
jgi:hypothetical protein